jgi:hypothetical protein
MKDEQKEKFRFIIKTPKIFSQYYVDITILEKGFAEGGVSITLQLIKEEWGNLLKFLEKTNNPDNLPPHKIAFSGYEISEDRIFYVGDTDFNEFLSMANEELLRISDSGKKNKIIRNPKLIIDKKREDHIKMEQGEILNKHLILINKNIMIKLGRENFRRLRDECFLFEDRKDGGNRNRVIGDSHHGGDREGDD